MNDEKQQEARFTTDEYQKKRAAIAKKSKKEKEIALSGLVASAQSERLQSRAGLAHLQNMGEPVDHSAANVVTTGDSQADDIKTPQMTRRTKSSEFSAATTTSINSLDLDDTTSPPKRLLKSAPRSTPRSTSKFAVRQSTDVALPAEIDADDADGQPAVETLLQQFNDAADEQPPAFSGASSASQDAAEGVTAVDDTILESMDPMEVAARYSRQGQMDGGDEFRGKAASSSSAMPLTNKESMTYVQTHLNWPPIFRELTTDEAMWLIDYLENLWCLRNSESIAQADIARRRRKRKLSNRSADRRADRDDDDDESLLRGGEDEEENEDDEDDGNAPVGRSNRSDARPFGPGGFRNIQMRYTVDEVMTKDVISLVRERFDIAEDAPFIDIKMVDQLASGMHSYIAEIGAVLLREREKSQDFAAHSAALMDATNPHERNQALLEALVGKIPHIDNRLKMLQQHVANARGCLYSQSCLRDPHLPRDLPLECKILGLASGTLHQRSKQLEPDYAQTQIQLRLGECQRNRWKRFDNAIWEEIIINGHHTQAYQKKMAIRQWVWQQPDPFSETQEWLQATKTNTVDVVHRYLSNATHTTDYLPELKRDRTQWSFNNGIYTASDDAFWEYGKAYASPNCPFNRDTVSAKLFEIDFPLDIVRKAPPQIEVKSITRIFEAQQWPTDVINWVWVLFGRMFYRVGEHDNWQVAPYFKGLAGTGKSTLVETFQRIYEPSDVGVLSNNMEEKFGLQTHYDKFIVLGPECRQNFRLDQADFQTMISGERMSIARKNLDTVEINWSAPIMLAGNLYPRWADSGGSVSRRMVPLLFSYPVPEEKSAPNLQTEIDLEMPMIIVKANRFYRAMYMNFAKQNIWKVLPPTLKRNRVAMKQETDHIAEYLQTCMEEIDPEKALPIHDFLQGLNQWTKDRNYKIPRLNVSTAKQELVQQSLKCGTITDANGRIIDVIYGIRLPPPQLLPGASNYAAQGGRRQSHYGGGVAAVGNDGGGMDIDDGGVVANEEDRESIVIEQVAPNSRTIKLKATTGKMK